MTRLTLYARELCHLCYDMERAVQACRSEYDFELEFVDIDRDPQLVARYGESVPVLMADDVVLCRSHWDRKGFDALFRKIQ